MSIKEQQKNKIRQSHNRKYKNALKKQLKNFNHYLKQKELNPEELKKLFQQAQKAFDKAKQKKVIHKNKVARRVSQLQKKLNELNERKGI